MQPKQTHRGPCLMANLILDARAAFVLPCDPEDTIYWDLVKVAADPATRLSDNRFYRFKRLGIIAGGVHDGGFVEGHTLTPEGLRVLGEGFAQARGELLADGPCEQRIARAVVAYRRGFDACFHRNSRFSRTHWENLIRIGGASPRGFSAQHASVRVLPYSKSKLVEVIERGFYALTERGWRCLNLSKLKPQVEALLESYE